MPVTVNLGARYSTTDVDAEAVQSDIVNVVPTTDQTLFANVFGPARDINESQVHTQTYFLA